jgi:TolA-binding protein
MSEKMSKQVQAQIDELNARLEESARTIQDLQGQKARVQNENVDLTRQLEDSESRVNQLNKERQALLQQLEEAKRSLEEETRVGFVI